MIHTDDVTIHSATNNITAYEVAQFLWKYSIKI